METLNPSTKKNKKKYKPKKWLFVKFKQKQQRQNSSLSHMITLKHLPDGSHLIPHWIHFTAEAVIPTAVPPLPNPPRAPRPAKAREWSGSLLVLTEEARKVRKKKQVSHGSFTPPPTAGLQFINAGFRCGFRYPFPKERDHTSAYCSATTLT